MKHPFCWIKSVQLPLAEQNRIVAKVEELINLCDQLTGLLQKAQETQIKLTDAVVENAL